MLAQTQALALAALVATPLSLAVAPPADANPVLQRWLAQVDVDGDRMVSRDELLRHRANRFPSMDQNRNGVLDRGDISQASANLVGAERLIAFLDRQDANKDGVVSFEELRHGPTPSFDFADADKDGLLSPSELTAFLAAVKTAR